jgi:hypothetical protein
MFTRKVANLCQGKTKSGKPCRAYATEGGLCFFHANPNKASELGAVGGRKNRHLTDETADTLPALDNNLPDLRTELSRLYSEVRSGKTSPKTAVTLASLLTLLDRQNQAAEMQVLRRAYAALQKEVAEMAGEAAGVDDNPDALHIPADDLPDEPEL